MEVVIGSAIEPIGLEKGGQFEDRRATVVHCLGVKAVGYS